MDSPPKLQRLMVPLPLMNHGSCNEPEASFRADLVREPLQVLQNSSPSDLDNYEKTMVDSAVSNIPGVFNEVYKAQISHAGEMTKKKQDLKALQEKLCQVEEVKRCTEEEISCVMNRILLARESITDKSKRVKEMDTALKRLVSEVVDKKTEIELLEDDIQTEKRNHEAKQDELNQFVQEVEAFESKSAVCQQIQTLKENIAKLQQQRGIIDKDMEEKENILNGKAKLMLTTQIEDLRQKLSVAKQENTLLMEQIEQEKEKQSKINQNTQVLGKKNAAQMTRQKRQLRELQLRNRQRQLQVTQLESNIQQATKTLDS